PWCSRTEVLPERYGLRDPASKMEEVGTRIAALHEISATSETNECLLQESYPHVPTIRGISSEDTAILLDWHEIVNDHFPGGTVKVQATSVHSVRIDHRIHFNHAIRLA